ncbi:MAG: hypothetical protein MJ248_03560 [Bacilli bacterium]|nr:hypothetical protein [Bacilli bacterium]
MEETRKELYKKYREEISKMEDESTFTNKEKVSRKVDTMLDKQQASRETSSLKFSFDDVVDTSDIYGNEVKTGANPLTEKQKKDKIFRGCVIAIIVILAAAIITIGILYFGGKL